MFQFPSNGKVYCKSKKGVTQMTTQVSIPFKRESVLQDVFAATHNVVWKGCVSIPFKRESVLQAFRRLTNHITVRFQFPSNGKVYCKQGNTSFSAFLSSFCFNSLQTGKCIASSHKGCHESADGCFNSLQTGKCIARTEKC